MRVTFLWAAIIIGLTSGCAEFRGNMGASGENDQNVLTGGPVTGTRIKDLPEVVRQTIREKAPSAEIAGIDKQTEDGRLIYKITLSVPGRNPSLYIADDGTVMDHV